MRSCSDSRLCLSHGVRWEQPNCMGLSVLNEPGELPEPGGEESEDQGISGEMLELEKEKEVLTSPTFPYASLAVCCLAGWLCRTGHPGMKFHLWWLTHLWSPLKEQPLQGHLIPAGLSCEYTKEDCKLRNRLATVSEGTKLVYCHSPFNGVIKILPHLLWKSLKISISCFGGKS